MIFVILYVENVERSAAFYAAMLGKQPAEQAPTFAMIPAAEGVMLGLWRREGVQPKPAGAPGASELALVLPDDAAVEAAHARWVELGTPIAQTPTHMDFGYTCVAVDPDGHRLRAFAPAGS